VPPCRELLTICHHQVSFMRPLDLANLTPLMERSIGRGEIKVSLIDGPVGLDRPDLAEQNIR